MEYMIMIRIPCSSVGLAVILGLPYVRVSMGVKVRFLGTDSCKSVMYILLKGEVLWILNHYCICRCV
ncbi:hypothetical protein BDV38DRAFT_253397 [Aspergillus pseudotamarii]|uniref:Uncharacterized protein n=1 Tax=Aspergillus pseudotamarii TaxID=132259 RepID=A0A5N6SJP3_ASPPS|nr:uncharacterized protein BDV38DRAFT_253397 [Aspergillus pseudotamarii]KAE8134918.1 hypothetical protein BDV38DRAFT_253397 [Aspergillus pseudotamarii]